MTSDAIQRHQSSLNGGGQRSPLGNEAHGATPALVHKRGWRGRSTKAGGGKERDGENGNEGAIRIRDEGTKDRYHKPEGDSEAFNPWPKDASERQDKLTSDAILPPRNFFKEGGDRRPLKSEAHGAAPALALKRGREEEGQERDGRDGDEGTKENYR